MTLLSTDLAFASNPAFPNEWRIIDDVALAALPDPRYILSNVLGERTVSVIYGPPGSCKTTLNAGLNVAIATGRNWYGHEVRRRGPSLNCAAEDAPGWKMRVQAAKVAAGIPAHQQIGVHTFPEAIDLGDDVVVEQFIRFVRAGGVDYVKVDFDTFASCTPGAAENSSEDMTAAMGNARRISAGLDCTVTIIHHSNASGTRERGHSAMRGAADTMISVTPVDDLIKVECSKQRNGAPFSAFDLKLVPMSEGGCVLRYAGDVLPATQLTAMQAKALDALRDIAGTDGATKTAWRQACPDIAERSFYKVCNALVDKGFAVRLGQQFIVGAGR